MRDGRTDLIRKICEAIGLPKGKKTTWFLTRLQLLELYHFILDTKKKVELYDAMVKQQGE